MSPSSPVSVGICRTLKGGFAQALSEVESTQIFVLEPLMVVGTGKVNSAGKT